MARREDRIDVEWETNKELSVDGRALERMTLEVLMDVRAELRRMNGLLHCHNFTGIPMTLKAISRKLPARKPRKKVA